MLQIACGIRQNNLPRFYCGSLSYGFSLLELVVVMAAISVLLTLAVPQYRNHLVAEKRRLAENCLLAMSMMAELQAQEQNNYNSISLLSLDAPCRSENPVAKSYNFLWQNEGEHYLLKALPIGNQAVYDSGCANLLLDDLGRKSVTGYRTNRACW